MNWSSATSPEIATHIKNGRTLAFLPLGAIEQHGPHLAVSYDSKIAKRLSADLSIEFNGWCLPSFEYGMSEHHIGFAGTITIPGDILRQFVIEIARSLGKQGIETLILINGHGGNYGWMKLLPKLTSQGLPHIIHDADDPVLFKSIREIAQASAKPLVNEALLGLHAGLFETSLALHTHPEAVRKNSLANGLLPSNPALGWGQNEISQIISEGLAIHTPNGVIGDARLADDSSGKLFYQILISNFIGLIKAQLRMRA